MSSVKFEIIATIEDYNSLVQVCPAANNGSECTQHMDHLYFTAQPASQQLSNCFNCHAIQNALILKIRECFSSDNTGKHAHETGIT
jgi:hypothetical protein